MSTITRYHRDRSNVILLAAPAFALCVTGPDAGSCSRLFFQARSGSGRRPAHPFCLSYQFLPACFLRCRRVMHRLFMLFFLGFRLYPAIAPMFVAPGAAVRFAGLVWGCIATAANAAKKQARCVSNGPAGNLVAGTGFEPVTFGL